MWNVFMLLRQDSENVTPIEHTNFISMTVDGIFDEHLTAAAARTPGRRLASVGNSHGPSLCLTVLLSSSACILLL